MTRALACAYVECSSTGWMEHRKRHTSTALPLDHRGSVIAALSTTSPNQRLPHPVLLCSAEGVQAALEEISQELGHPLESLREGGDT